MISSWTGARISGSSTPANLRDPSAIRWPNGTSGLNVRRVIWKGIVMIPNAARIGLRTIAAMARAVGLFLGAGMLMAGCGPDPAPEVRTFGVVYPLCVVWCDASVHVTDAPGGTVSTNTTETEGNAP